MVRIGRKQVSPLGWVGWGGAVVLLDLLDVPGLARNRRIVRLRVAPLAWEHPRSSFWIADVA
jgi:hypothetical protein